MQNAVLVISMIGVFVFGYILIGRVDSFLEKGGFSGFSGDTVRKDVLVFSSSEKQNNEAESMISSLTDLSLSYDIVQRPQIPDKCSYDIVLTISGNDMDNLMLCATAKRVYTKVFTLAKCNDKRYECIFCREDVDAFVFDTKSAAAIIYNRVERL